MLSQHKNFNLGVCNSFLIADKKQFGDDKGLVFGLWFEEVQSHAGEGSGGC